jgi:hypothetical protein
VDEVTVNYVVKVRYYIVVDYLDHDNLQVVEGIEKEQKLN